MFDKVVVYSPLCSLKPAFLKKLGLLYDRVILPLPDSIRSGKIEWLSKLATHCEYTQYYLRSLRAFYNDDLEYCRPLDIEEYSGLAMGDDTFRLDFLNYVNKNVGDKKWRILLDNGIDIAQDILNFYITQDYIRENSGTRIVFPYEDSGRNNDRLVDEIAEILKIEAVSCALHDFELPDEPNNFAQLLKNSKAIESRYALMKHLYDLSDQLETLWRTERDKTNLKHELRKLALDLAESYNRFIEDLDQCSDHIRINRCQGTNSLRIARRVVRPLPVPTEASIGIEGVSLTTKFNQSAYPIYYQSILNESERISERITERRWQRDLLTFRCDMDREFGHQEKYKVLTQTAWWRYLCSKLPILS